MNLDLAGKTVVITGAARGQGAAEAELLVRAGRWSSAPTCSKPKALPFKIIWRKILRGSSSTGN
jgi:hypothetical protein